MDRERDFKRIKPVLDVAAPENPAEAIPIWAGPQTCHHTGSADSASAPRPGTVVFRSVLVIVVSCHGASGIIISSITCM
jgi:hypothetical protein